MHLDLKPENILISQTTPNCYKICDFGCSQIAIQSKLTKYDNQLFGTFNYLAPENYLNYHGKLTNTAADIWSFGVILYEMIYKKLPLEVGTDGLINRKAIQQFFQGDEEKIAYPASPNALPDIIEIIKQMLKAKPKDRITWVKLKELLMNDYGMDEYEFINTKKIYFKHVTITKIFLTFIVILRKDMELNPHPFWKNNHRILSELADTLLHLCHIFCLKFQAIYGYKLQEFLEEDWLKSLAFMRQHIAFEE
jgi:serine/threonine protein kinase